MLWKGLSVFSASSSPIVVVLSGSMEPAFQRGDLLFLWNRSPRAEVGEIVVFVLPYLDGRESALLTSDGNSYNVRGKDIPYEYMHTRSPFWFGIH